MAGRYAAQLSNAGDRPYWQYVAVMDDRTESGEVVRLFNAALTNRPNLDLAALNTHDSITLPPPENPMALPAAVRHEKFGVLNSNHRTSCRF